MAEFEDTLKLFQWSQNILKSLEPSFPLSGLLKSQEAITRSLSGSTMLTEMVRSMRQPKLIDNPILAVMESINHSMLLPKFAIPKPTLDAIESINRWQEQLFGNLGSITEVLTKQQLIFPQINSWQFATAKLSGQLASIAVKRQKWDLIDDFESITEEVVSLKEKLSDENEFTHKALAELKGLIQKIESKVDKIDADVSTPFLKFIAIVGFILALLGEARNWLPKPECATKEDVALILKEQLVVYQNKLKEEKQFRITTRKCAVSTHPQTKSIVIETLPAQFEVFVIQINHKWIYVSYFSPYDQLPRMGWILKKYLKSL